MAETDKDGRETANYTRGDELLSVEKGGKIWYYLYDGHGRIRLLTSEAGRITDRYAYDAYGNLLQKEGNTENEFLYTGEQYNVNTGLYYLRARYIDPSTRTFINMDSYQGSIYDPVTLHKYRYANANPVIYTDPSGYSATTVLLTLVIDDALNQRRPADAYDVAVEILQYALDNIKVICDEAGIASESIAGQIKAAIYEAKKEEKKKGKKGKNGRYN